MQKQLNYIHKRKQILNNLHHLSGKQLEYMELYAKEGFDMYEIAELCDKEHTTISRTLSRAYAKLRPRMREERELRMDLTVNEKGDIIKMKMARTPVRGWRGRIKGRGDSD